MRGARHKDGHLFDDCFLLLQNARIIIFRVLILHFHLYQLADSLQKHLITCSTNSFITNIIIQYEQKVLSELLLCFNAAYTLDKEKTINFLKKNWERTKHTLCSYTALPDSAFTKLLCQIAEELARQDKVPAIHYLMPGVQTEPMNEARYADLCLLPLDELLHHHILGEGGDYLIPVAHLLLFINGAIECSDTSESINNPYYNYQKHGREFVRLSADEKRRLYAHSPATQALHQHVLTLLDAEKETPNLLIKLKNLCKALALNDAHGGIGHQEHAGEGVYQAISHFFDYYDQLSRKKRGKVPVVIQKELGKLRHFAATNSLGHIDSCIGTRGEALLKALNQEGNRAIVETISLSVVQNTQLKENAQTNFHNAKNELALLLTQKQYKGMDKLNITPQFIKWLDTHFEIDEPEDFQLFMRLPAALIDEFFTANPQLKQDICDFFPTLDEVVALLTTDYEESSLKSILCCLAERSPSLFDSAQQVGRMLAMLNVRQINLLGEVLQQKNKIKSLNQFIYLLQPLNEAQRKVLFPSLVEQLVAHIQGMEDLTHIFDYLNETQRRQLLEVMHQAQPMQVPPKTTNHHFLLTAMSHPATLIILAGLMLTVGAVLDSDDGFFAAVAVVGVIGFFAPRSDEKETLHVAANTP